MEITRQSLTRPSAISCVRRTEKAQELLAKEEAEIASQSNENPNPTNPTMTVPTHALVMSALFIKGGDVIDGPPVPMAVPEGSVL